MLCVFATSALRCGRISKRTRDEEQAKRTRQKEKSGHGYKTLRRFDIKPILIQWTETSKMKVNSTERKTRRQT